MLGLLATIFPLLLAEIVSPVVLGAVLLILSGKNYPIKRILFFLAGSVVAVAIFGYVGLLLGSKEAVEAGQGAANAEAPYDLIFGIVLILLGVKIYFSKPREDRREKEEELKDPVKKESVGILKFLFLGFFLNIINFSSAIPYLAATREIGEADIGETGKIIMVAIGGIFFVIPVIVPLLVYVFFPATAEKILRPIQRAAEKYGKYVAVLIAVGFGIYLVARGLG